MPQTAQPQRICAKAIKLFVKLKRSCGKVEYDMVLRVYEYYENVAKNGVAGTSSSHEKLNQLYKKHKGKQVDKLLKKR